MTTLTRATLGKLAERATKDLEILGHKVRIQRPSPLEFSQYQLALVDPKTRGMDVARFPDAILALVAKMWVDGAGKRLFADNELDQLGGIDLEFYQRLSEECQAFAQGADGAKRALGESAEATSSDLPAAYA